MKKILGVLFINPVYAATSPTPVPATWQNCMVNETPTIKCLEVVFGNVLEAVVALAGIALFIMLVVGSFRFLTSGGDPKQTETARKTMTSAILGLVLIIGSYLILRLIANFTGIDSLLEFTIPTF